MSKLKPWIQVVEPHEDIRKGRFDESVFAADLGEVLAGRGALEYRDPELFFKKTYLTQGLSALISNVVLRLSERKGSEPVIQLQTPFGGGKTHTLLTIYHLIKNHKIALKFKGIQEVLTSNGIKEIPAAKIAVVDGTALNPNEIRTTAEGLKIKTLWGEIFYQLGGKEAYNLVEDDDQKRVSPGTEKIGKIVSKLEPVVILLDETVQYMVKASGVKVGDSTLAGQTLAFIQELSEVVSNSKKSLLMASLPSSANELMDEAGEKVYDKLTKIFGRIETIKEPVQGEEIYEIVRKRLFENLGPEDEAKKVAEAYWEFYQQHKDDLPRNVREVSYKRLLEKAYPFHPETINVLRERWGTIQNFQRTRGVLRLLALVVGDLYKKKHSGYLIHPSHFNLASSEISGELLKFVGRQFEGVIASDISGHTAKAPQVDRELGSEYAKESLTEGLATAIFVYSFSGKPTTERGINEPSLRLALSHPDMTFPIFAEVLSRAIQRFWYLDAQNGIYRFTAQPNLNKILVEKEDAIKKDDIVEFAEGKLWEMIGEKFQKKYRFPKEDRDIVDAPVLSLIVLSLEFTKGKQTWKETEKFIQKLINNYGTKHRRFKNVLVFLVGDENYYQQLIKNVKRYLALQNISEEYKIKGLTEEQRRDLQNRVRNAETEVPQIIASTYRHIIIGNSKELKSYDMGAFIYVPSNPISNLVWQTLRDNEKLLEKLDPNLLIGTKWSLWPKTKDSIQTKTLWEYFTQYTNLPILANENVLKSSICQGIQRGLFGYGLGDGKKFDTIFFKKYVEEEQIEISESAWLLRPEIAIELLPKEEVKEAIPSKIEAEIVAKEPREFREGAVRKVREISLEIDLDWQNWDNFFREVIDPLREENADIKLNLKLKASSEEGIKKDTLDLRIIESLNQRGIKWKFIKD